MTILETAPQIGPLDSDGGQRSTTQVLSPEARERHRNRLTWIGGAALLLVVSLVAAVVATGEALHKNAQVTSTTPAQFTPMCPPSSLRTSFDLVNSGLAGSILIGFQLENVGASGCSVQGHPGAIFRDRAGPVTDITVERMGSIMHGQTVTSSPRIVLRRGARAYADMIVQNCTGYSPGPLTSVQLIYDGVPIRGVVTAGHGGGQPFGIGGVCRPGDPGTYVAVSQLEPIRNIT